MTSLAGQLMRSAGRFVPPAAVMALYRPAAVYFHGVEAALEDPAVQGNHHTRDRFWKMVRALKAHFDVLPLSALDDVFADPSRHPRALFLMADDGYGNMIAAADILEELKLPWTLFVSTQHIDTGEYNPVFLARLFFHYARPYRYTLANIEGDVDLGSSERTREAERVIARLKTFDEQRARQTLASMQAILSDFCLDGLADLFPSDAFLTWAGVAELARRGVEIGAHAHWHWPMNAHQSHEELQRQAALPKRRIETMIGTCRYFAYPFGHRGDICKAAWHAVRDAGYAYGFTALSGTLGAGSNRYLLPRFGLAPGAAGDATAIAMLRTANAHLRRFQERMR